VAGYNTVATGHNPNSQLDAKPESPTWTREYDETTYFTMPTLGEESACFGFVDFDPTPSEASVRKYALMDGSEAWSLPMPYRQVSQPTLALGPENAQTLFIASGQDTISGGPGQGVVVALDPATGVQRWTWEIDRALAGPVIVAGELALVRNNSHGKAAVHALDVADGTEQWRYRTGDVLHNTPTVVEETVFVSSGREQLAALRLGDGSERWTQSTKADSIRPVVLPQYGRILMGFTHGLEAFCARSGALTWRLHTSTFEERSEDYLGVSSEPVLIDDTLFVRTSDTSPSQVGDPGHLYGVDPQTGSVRWQLSDRRPASDIVGAGSRAILRRAPADQILGPRAGSGTIPPDAELVGLTSTGDVSWSLTAPWKPMAVNSESLLVYAGSPRWSSSQVTIGRIDIP
jgi:outer membrane protein assembly factor BamB